ncbi:hypothetical protein [Christiangramia lutea]|nr:hypothetical protein [Christiangramia lutea]
MRTLESVIQDFENQKGNGVTHRRPFLNLRSPDVYLKWHEKSFYA